MAKFDPRAGFVAFLARVLLKLDSWDFGHRCRDPLCLNRHDLEEWEKHADAETCCGICGCCTCWSALCAECRPLRFNYDSVRESLYTAGYET